MPKTKRGNGDHGALPDFLIIGAQKCGTSTLRVNLAQHPGVHMPDKKEQPMGEMHFFNNENYWERGVDWYRSHFSRPELLQGEKTPDYMSHLVSHRRMHAIVPEARLIVMLRNPVDRAYSAWNHFNQAIDRTRRRGWEVMEFEQALERGVREQKGVFAGLFAKGMYGLQINHLLQFYARERIHFIITERMYRAPEEEYQKVLAFLGLERNDQEIDNRNVRSYPQPMQEETRIRLEEFFRPHNELLFNVLGERIHEWEGE